GLDVAGPVAVEVGPTLDEAGLGGDVEDDLGAGEDRIEGIGAKVEGMKPEAGPALETGEVAALDGGIVVGNEGVDADDLVAASLSSADRSCGCGPSSVPR